MNRQRIFFTWRDVFRNWKYLLLTAVISILFYSFNAVVGNWKSLSLFYEPLGFLGSIKFFFILLWSFGNTIKFSSFISLILVSILFGVLFSLLAYKTRMVKTAIGKTSVFASIGIFIGVLAPGCTACGVGLLSVFGLSAAFLSFLPFGGLEISILSIGIISFSILKISDTMHSCDIPIKETDKKLKGGIKINE
ncbi:hypothetical protein GW924_03405 [Candidatus Pacearchaeota archaeon]|nr:hypothetical protein [Candidatus Pacearchaeota archaeon]